MIMDVEFNYSTENSCFSIIAFSSSSISVYANIWHVHLRHIGQDRMNRLVRDGLLGQLANMNIPTCEHFLAGKSTRKPFGKTTRVEFPLQLVHFDIYANE